MCATRATLAPTVGCAIEVYWPDDDQWYRGTLQRFYRPSGRFVVDYDDGECETLDLTKERWRFAPAAGSSGSAGAPTVPGVKKRAMKRALAALERSTAQTVRVALLPPFAPTVVTGEKGEWPAPGSSMNAVGAAVRALEAAVRQRGKRRTAHRTAVKAQLKAARIAARVNIRAVANAIADEAVDRAKLGAQVVAVKAVAGAIARPPAAAVADAATEALAECGRTGTAE